LFIFRAILASSVLLLYPRSFNCFHSFFGSFLVSLFLNFYKRRNPHNKKLVLQPVTEEFVFKELCSLNANKSTGVDEIPARCLYSEQYLLLQFYFCTPDLLTVSTVFLDHF
jgi:hypothetical protein